MAVFLASAVHVHRTAALAVAHVVLQPRCVGTAVGLGLLKPGLPGSTEVITAAPAVTALMLQLLGAEAMGAPLRSGRLGQGDHGAQRSSRSGEQGEELGHGSSGRGIVGDALLSFRSRKGDSWRLGSPQGAGEGNSFCRSFSAINLSCLVAKQQGSCSQQFANRPNSKGGTSLVP